MVSLPGRPAGPAPRLPLGRARPRRPRADPWWRADGAPNGIRIRCLEPLAKYAIAYDDPDGGDEIHVDLTFTAVAKPNYLGHGHLDQR